MKNWVGKYKFLAFLALISSSLGVSGEEWTTTCDDVQGQLKELKNSVDMAVEKLEKKVDDVVSYHMRNKGLSPEKEVERLKAETQKIVPLTEKVQQLEVGTQNIVPVTEKVLQLKTNDDKLIERMDEVTGNISAIMEEVQGLKAEVQKIQTLTEDVLQLKTKDQEITERINVVAANISAITEEVQMLKPENQTNLGAEKSDFLIEMKTSPKARLYSGANFTGDFEDYTFEMAKYKGSCHELKTIEDQVTSVDTFGKCVRLFDYYSCQGRSVAVYPGSGNAENVLNSNMTVVFSIGPCLAEEFEDFHFKDGTKQTIVKNSSNPRKYFPDSVQFYSKEKENEAISPSGSSFSLDRYLLGPGNRSEFLHAWIYPEHLKISQPEFEMQNTSIFRSFEKEPGDIVGYGIPPSLGGPANESYNAFPQTISGNKKWTELTSEIRPLLEGGVYAVHLALNFAYENQVSSRPTGFYFWIAYYSDEGSYETSYGRVEN